MGQEARADPEAVRVVPGAVREDTVQECPAAYQEGPEPVGAPEEYPAGLASVEFPEVLDPAA